MELSEATALSDVFITRLLFRIHAVPNDLCSPRADSWVHFEASSATPQRAITDAHQHAALFSADREIEDGWTRYLVISALPIPNPSNGCIALLSRNCGIYDRRPLSCRTVPLHYSRPLAALGSQIKRFTGTPGYECDTSAKAPTVLVNGQIQAEELKAARRDAAALQTREKKWRKQIVAATKTGSHNMPRYADIHFNSRNGHATSVAMASAWSVAEDAGILSRERIAEIYANQARLLANSIAANDSDTGRQLVEMLAEYELDDRRTQPWTLDTRPG